MLPFYVFLWVVMLIALGSPFVGILVAKKCNVSADIMLALSLVTTFVGFMVAVTLVIYAGENWYIPGVVKS